MRVNAPLEIIVLKLALVTTKGTVKKLFFTVPVELKGIGKRLQNEETEPKPSVSGYPKVYAIHREAKFIRSKKAQKKRKYYIKM